MPPATLDEIRTELAAVADDAPAGGASELRSLAEGLSEMPDEVAAKRTRLRETGDRLSELEHDVGAGLAEDLHTIQQNLQVVADDVGH